MPDLQPVFQELVSIMRPYAEQLATKADTPENLYVDTHYVQKNKKPLFFGAVQLKKSVVSFHLMPVYVQPALLDQISPALRKRMQGQSCFNFASVDASLFAELHALTEAAYASYREQGFLDHSSE